MRVVAAFILALVLVVSAGGAYGRTGEDFLPGCEKAASRNIHPNDALLYEVGVCTGVVSAILGSAEILDHRYRFCPPATATTLEALRIVVDYLERRPDLWDQDFRITALAALMLAWPCF
jgi:hypothetical protein